MRKTKLLMVVGLLSAVSGFIGAMAMNEVEAVSQMEAVSNCSTPAHTANDVSYPISIKGLVYDGGTGKSLVKLEANTKLDFLYTEGEFSAKGLYGIHSGSSTSSQYTSSKTYGIDGIFGVEMEEGEVRTMGLGGEHKIPVELGDTWSCVKFYFSRVDVWGAAVSSKVRPIATGEEGRPRYTFDVYVGLGTEECLNPIRAMLAEDSDAIVGCEMKVDCEGNVSYLAVKYNSDGTGGLEQDKCGGDEETDDGEEDENEGGDSGETDVEDAGDNEEPEDTTIYSGEVDDLIMEETSVVLDGATSNSGDSEELEKNAVVGMSLAVRNNSDLAEGISNDGASGEVKGTSTTDNEARDNIETPAVGENWSGVFRWILPVTALVILSLIFWLFLVFKRRRADEEDEKA
jgi:hypothetical protein